MRRRHVVLTHLDVAHDVLAHHDRVVDQDADRQRETEQRHRVERKPERPDRDERGQHRNRQRQSRDDRRSPRVEEHEYHQNGEQRSDDERFDHVAHRVVHADAGVLHDVELHAGRQRLLDLRHFGADFLAHIRRAVSLRLDDVDTDSLRAVVERKRALLLSAVDRIGYLPQSHDLPVALGDDEIVEVLWTFQAAL